MKDITLIVLAAGEGKRLWPLTTSKALFPFFGLPMLAHSIRDVPETISRMIIVTNPDNDEFIRTYQFPIPTSTVIQKEPRGMADAMLACRDALDDSPILVINVDDIIDPKLLVRVVDAANTSNAYGAVPGWKTPKHGPFGYLSFEGDKLTGIVEKPEAGHEPSPYAYLVCDYIRDAKAFLDELEKTTSTKDDVFEKALTNLMVKHDFTFVPYEGYFAPLKYPWHVLDIMQTLFVETKKHIGKNVVIRGNVVIEGPVYIDDGVKIFENTKIVGPCYIGKNTIIGNNNIIRESHIGAGCVTGFNTDITRSYIGDDCWFHSNYIGDSVLEGNVSMGSGTVLANLRLDDGQISSAVGENKVSTGRNKLGAIIGRGVRIGVNVSIMPGIKIGAHSFVGAGVVLDADLPQNSYCLANPRGYTVKKNTKEASTSRDEFKGKI